MPLFVPPRGGKLEQDTTDARTGIRKVKYSKDGNEFEITIFPGGHAVELLKKKKSSSNEWVHLTSVFLHQDQPGGGRLETRFSTNPYEVITIYIGGNGDTTRKTTTKKEIDPKDSTQEITTTTDVTYFPGTNRKQKSVKKKNTDKITSGWQKTPYRTKTTTKDYSQKPNKVKKKVVLTEWLGRFDESGRPVEAKTRTTEVRGKKTINERWDAATKKWVTIAESKNR